MMFTPRLVHRRNFFAIVVLSITLLTPHPASLAKGGGGGSGKSQASSAGGARHSTPGRQYDSQGRYIGRVDNDGRRYDSQGRYQGRIDAQTGRQYDSQGRYLGRIEANGRQYDSQGKYLGRVESNGRLYDDNGRYTGRIDSEGRQYDAQGRYTGRLDGVPLNPSAAPAAKAQTGQPNQIPNPAMTVEGNRAVAPFVFCNYGDKDCGK
jgi:hypothetical protein